ncbi:DASH complex subunit Ask1-domain-containing protein [Apiosordaria backusii]|uniref:DASH complex subunit ASK1 n=1 Tax=Apiosordaria backusii TaxID=314023 RepID=A0AA40BKI0_9PEZI|nr:DASH complex subunit Ask1-domain-containing protein [Apiosordaria backusii]
MSRPSSTVPARPLTLTEELEKLEQSITLTLQEIDHNFSRAHRIVTGSILPLVEQYGEHSRNVWEATKFWKQFFEASANVSLSGYEELANNEPEESTEIETTVNESTAQYNTPRNREQQHEDVSALEADQSSVVYPNSGRRQQQQHHHHQQDESMLDHSDEDVSGSTPRPPVGKTIPSRSQMANLSSPYENLKREYSQKPGTPGGYQPKSEPEDEDNTSVLIQEHTARLPDMSMHPRHSPEQSHSHTHFLDSEEDDDDDLAFLKPGGGKNKKNTDPVLHHLKDKNFRILATPHKGHSGVSPLKWKITQNKPSSSLFSTPGKGKDPTLTTSRPIWADSPGDSPEIALPQLRSAAFMSPAKAAYRSAHIKSTKSAMSAPRTPGVSVQTPATRGGKTRDVYGGGIDMRRRRGMSWGGVRMMMRMRGS